MRPHEQDVSAARLVTRRSPALRPPDRDRPRRARLGISAEPPGSQPRGAPCGRGCSGARRARPCFGRKRARAAAGQRAWVARWLKAVLGFTSAARRQPYTCQRREIVRASHFTVLVERRDDATQHCCSSQGSLWTVTLHTMHTINKSVRKLSVR